MPKFNFSQNSIERLKGVHPDLVKVVHLALSISDVDFAVTYGLRTAKAQDEYLKKGTTKTKNSRHLTGHAVDLTPYDEQGRAITGKLGDDPANWPYFVDVADAMKRAAKVLKIAIEWGGDWPHAQEGDLVDGYHFQLTWRNYPLR